MEQAREQEIQAGTPVKADTYWRPNCQALRKLRGFLTEQRWLFEQWAVVGGDRRSLRSGRWEKFRVGSRLQAQKQPLVHGVPYKVTCSGRHLTGPNGHAELGWPRSHHIRYRFDLYRDCV